MKTIKLSNFEIGAGNPLVLLAGPCVLESYERSLYIGKTVKEITSRLGIPYVFKASFDKANRSSYNGYRGPGMEEGLKWLQSIKEELNVPVVTDIHNETQVEPASKVVDILQIPAFLSRQTDLLYTAAKSGCVVNVKKGQFLAPADLKNVVKKLEEAGSEKILLTERGASFGYNNLVVDMRSFPIMRSTSSAGNREYVEFLARGAAGVGVDGFFMEVHDNPEEALCDGPNMVYLDKLEDLLKDLIAINEIARKKINK